MNNDVLNKLYQYWFNEIQATQEYITTRLPIWFLKDSKADQEITSLFKETLEKVDPHDEKKWISLAPKDFIAFILLIDQVSRNIYRNNPRAYYWDKLALALVKNRDLELEKYHLLERFFLSLPFQHSEDLSDQEKSMELFSGLYTESSGELKNFFRVSLHKAELHFQAIKEFGRFPHRNRYLGRNSNSLELNFLNNPEHHF